jgi:hypothetical protein
MQHLAGVSAGGQQRVVAEHPGVAVGSPTLVVAVDLADGGVHVDDHWAIAGAGARRPCPAQDGLGDPVELADVAEGEGAQERLQRAWCHHPVAEHLGGGAGAQHVGVVDAVAAGQQRVHQGQHLAAGPVVAGPGAKVDQLVDGRFDPQTLGQRCGQQQPSVGDGVVVIEDHHKAVGTVRRWHRESALLIGTNDVSATPFSQLRGPFS